MANFESDIFDSDNITVDDDYVYATQDDNADGSDYTQYSAPIDDFVDAYLGN
jgi:hypothetical protein